MDIEIRSKNEAIVSGYINAVERYSRPLKRFGRKFVEKVKAGVFDDAIKEAEREHRAIEMLIDHDKKRKVADTLSGSLELREDNIGLYGRAKITDEKTIEELREYKAKGWSFAFHAIKDHFEKKDDELEERELVKVSIPEISLLIHKTPAYMATSVEVRDNEDIEIEYRGYEDISIEDRCEPERNENKSAEGYKARVKYLELI